MRKSQHKPERNLPSEPFPLAVWGDLHAQFCLADADSRSTQRNYAALVFPFYHTRLLLANIKGRGWTVPGGRVHEHELPEDAAARETREETGAVVQGLVRLGAYTLTSTSSAVAHYVPVFIAIVSEIGSLQADSESDGVQLVTQAQLPDIYYIWDPLIAAVCTLAYSTAAGLGWLSE